MHCRGNLSAHRLQRRARSGGWPSGSGCPRALPPVLRSVCEEISLPLSSTPTEHPLPTEIVEKILHGTRVLACMRVSGSGTIVRANPAAGRATGTPAAELAGRRIAEFLAQDDGERMERWLVSGVPSSSELVLLNFVSGDHQVQTLQCRLFAEGTDLIVAGEPDIEEDRELSEDLLRLNNELAVLSRESARRSRELEAARARLADTLAELESSYWHLRKIQEYLPVCMRCGNLKTGEAQWESVVDYLRSHEVFVSHGYCPTCAKVLERELES
jgi:PAS domain-containing protein